eukprot:gene8946-5973_t
MGQLGQNLQQVNWQQQQLSECQKNTYQAPCPEDIAQWRQATGITVDTG